MATGIARVWSAPALAQRRQTLDRLTAAALRALAGDPRLDYRNRQPRLGPQPVRWLAPHVACTEEDGLAAGRAAADAYALRARYTQPAIQMRHAPEEPLARLLYEWFETFRVEALAPRCWPGVQRNIATQFVQWSGRFHDSTLMESRLGPLLFAIIQFVHFRLHGRPPPETYRDAMSGTLRHVMPQLGPSLRAMTRHLREPQSFAAANAQLAGQIAALVHDTIASAPEGARAQPLGQSSFYILFDPEPVGDEALPVAARSTGPDLAAAGARYRVFTHEFDRQINASRLVRPAQLGDYAQQLAAQVAQLHLPLRRLARELAARLQHSEVGGWSFDEEAGRIDARQLTRLVTSPMEQRLFQLPLSTPANDAVITLLIDCTGSMRQHATQVALFATALNRIAALARIPLEVLGFSTHTWNGGQARARWLQQRRPAQPGRVADRLHLIFQSAADRPASARRQIGALLKADLYREGLDGEAVQWAAARLRQSEARRRLLLVLSDGCPNETATAQLNSPNYLEQHLQRVVQRQGQQGIEMIGIGLGLDLRNFYPSSLPVEPDALARANTFARLWQLFRT